MERIIAFKILYNYIILHNKFSQKNTLQKHEENQGFKNLVQERARDFDRWRFHPREYLGLRGSIFRVERGRHRLPREPLPPAPVLIPEGRFK